MTISWHHHLTLEWNFTFIHKTPVIIKKNAHWDTWNVKDYILYFHICLQVLVNCSTYFQFWWLQSYMCFINFSTFRSGRGYNKKCSAESCYLQSCTKWLCLCEGSPETDLGYLLDQFQLAEGKQTKTYWKSDWETRASWSQWSHAALQSPTG